MRKNLMILVNLLIILAILIFVAIYVRSEQQKMIASKTEAYKNMTVAMESVTTNYLVGEQQVCSSWGGYINANDMHSEEAIAFVRDCVNNSDVMAHILFTEDRVLSGLSTQARPSDPGDYTVSYSNISLFGGSFEEFLQCRRNGQRDARLYQSHQCDIVHRVLLSHNGKGSPERSAPIGCAAAHHTGILL